MQPPLGQSLSNDAHLDIRHNAEASDADLKGSEVQRMGVRVNLRPRSVRQHDSEADDLVGQRAVLQTAAACACRDGSSDGRVDGEGDGSQSVPCTKISATEPRHEAVGYLSETTA